MSEAELYAIWAADEGAALDLLTGVTSPSTGYDRDAVERSLVEAAPRLGFTDGDRLEWDGNGWVLVEFVDEARIDVSFGPAGGRTQGQILGQVTGALVELGFWVYDLADGDWLGRRRAPEPPAAPLVCAGCGEVSRVWPCERCEAEVTAHCPDCHLEAAHF